MSKTFDVDAELDELAETLVKLDALVRSPSLRARIGEGLTRELRYPISTYRQRFPDVWLTAVSPIQTALF